MQSRTVRAYANAVERVARQRGISLDWGGRVRQWLDWAHEQARLLDSVDAVLDALSR